MPTLIDNKAIGARVKALREARGETLRSFSAHLGISHTAIAKIEQGQGISLETAALICHAFDIDLYYLTGIQKPTEKKR